MFERFTDRARRAIVVAQDEAREMGHDQIRPEHLLIGLTEGEGVAAKAMAQSGVDGAAMRARVVARTKSKPSARKLAKVPFSPEIKKAMELSLRAALGLGHKYIGTEHLFFGVQREAGERDEPLDQLLGVSAADVRERIMEMLGDVRPMLRDVTLAGPMRSPALQSAMTAARRQASGAPVTTGHLLAAMAADADSQAARALAALGVNVDALPAALMRVPIAGTSDDPVPAQSVSITVGETTTFISDPDVAAALEHLNSDELRLVIRKAIGPVNPDQAAS
jgi:ATP-dependent Clp protease ATP-binding subunit ClpA